MNKNEKTQKPTGGIYKNIKVPIKTLDTIIAILGTTLLIILMHLALKYN